MKRKNWRVNTEHPSRIRPFLKGPHHVLDSKSQLHDTADHETQGIGCKKRVSFRDLDSCKLEESASVPQERIQDPIFDEAKTSEYVFFKKLKEDAQRLHSRSRHQDKNQSINVNGIQYGRERSICHKNMKSLLPINATPDNLFPFISTPDNASLKSEVDMKRAGSTSSNIHNMQENIEQDGAPCKNASIFSQKRHKLHQLVAKTLFLEVDELFSKGNDIVTLLLSKLIPESNRNKSFEGLKTGTLESDTESKSFNSPEFGMRIREFQSIPATNFMEPECGPPLDVGFSSCWSEIFKTKELPDPNFSRCYSRRTFHERRSMELEYERAPPFFLTEDLNIRKHLTSRHLKELDEFHCSIKPLHAQEPQTSLLGWDVDNMVDESNLSTSQTTKLSLYPFLSSSFGYDQLKNLDESFTANEFHYPIKPLLGRETQNLLLGWDVDDMVNKINSSTGSQITDRSLNCCQLSSRCNDQERNLDDSFIASTLCTDSLFSHQAPTSQNTELSLNCFVSSLCNDLKRNFNDNFTESRCTESVISCHPNLLSLEFSSLATDKSIEKDVYAENSFYSFSHDMTNQLNMSESSNYGYTCSGNAAFPSLNQFSFIREVLNGRKLYPDMGTLSSAGFDFFIEPTHKQLSDYNLLTDYAVGDLQSEQLSSYFIGDANENRHLSPRRISEHLRDVMIAAHNWSSDSFQIALDEEKSHPLLLDKSYWDESDGEIYSDEDRLKL